MVILVIYLAKWQFTPEVRIVTNRLTAADICRCCFKVVHFFFCPALFPATNDTNQLLFSS